MHKRILAIALCLVMVSTVAATGAVSATTAAGKSNIRTLDVYWGWQVPIGKATLNLDTGHLVVNVNMNKARASGVWWQEGQRFTLEVFSPPSDGMSLWTPSYEFVVMSGLTADGTATVDTYLDPVLVTDSYMVTYFWNDPDAIMGAGVVS